MVTNEEIIVDEYPTMNKYNESEQYNPIEM